MTATKEPQVIKVKLSDLIHDPDNPNKMPEHMYQQLVANIREAGVMLQPILVQKAADGWKIVDGHHRATASEEAGLTHVLAVVWDGTEEMKRRVLGISFNKVRGALDLSLVQATFNDMKEAGYTPTEMTVTGYSEAEIGALLRISIDVDPDAVMENPSVSLDEPAEKKPRPLVLELTFSSREDFDRAKRGLKRAAGKGHELGDGLLALLDANAS